MSILRKDVNKILSKIKKGDVKFKNVLFEKTYNHLKILARRYVYNKNDVEDVASEVYLRVFEYIDSFDPHKDGYNWMCKILENCAIRWNRKYPTYEPIENHEDLAVTMDFGDLIATKAEVVCWMKAYDARDQKIIYLRFWENKTYVEIAQALGMKKSNVHKRISKIFKEIFEKEKKSGKNR